MADITSLSMHKGSLYIWCEVGNGHAFESTPIKLSLSSSGHTMLNAVSDDADKSLTHTHRHTHTHVIVSYGFVDLNPHNPTMPMCASSNNPSP